MKARELLLSDAVALAKRGVMDAQRMKEKGPPGYKSIAFDLLALLAMFREKWSVLDGKTLLQASELKHAQLLADRLGGLRAGGRAPVPAYRREPVLGRIAANPEQFPIVHREVRRALVRHFQYAVYFCVQASHIQVLAMPRQRRSPRLWKIRT